MCQILTEFKFKCDVICLFITCFVDFVGVFDVIVTVVSALMI